MQEISSSRRSDIIETDDAFITGVRGLARRWSFYISSGPGNLLGRMSNPLCLFHSASPGSKHEIEIMYFGRASEFLQMTLERMVIPDEGYTLEQVLSNLRKRDGRWAYELDDRHVVCTVDGKSAMLTGAIKPGAEINIFSRKSIFER